MFQAIHETRMPGLLHRGKVRDLYDLGDRLMIVATDRVSAFDVVMNQPVPGKGVVLTQISRFWLEKLRACTPNHLDYVVTRDRVPAGYEAYADQLAGRTMVVQRCQVLPVECVVRGYVFGSGWREYQAVGSISGVALPRGLRLAEKLPEPIFTPSTKASSGHDEPISFDQAIEHVRAAGWPNAAQLMHQARDRTLSIFREAAEHAAARGLILVDTKFEFGVKDGHLLLVDEVLTPDSSRYWEASSYKVGENPPSFDKQILRAYLETLNWDKAPPPPDIPERVLTRLRDRYLEAYTLLSGQRLSLDKMAETVR